MKQLKQNFSDNSLLDHYQEYKVIDKGNNKFCSWLDSLSEDDKKINLKNALNFSRKYFGEQESFGKINENVFSEFIQWLNLNKIEKFHRFLEDILGLVKEVLHHGQQY